MVFLYTISIYCRSLALTSLPFLIKMTCTKNIIQTDILSDTKEIPFTYPKLRYKHKDREIVQRRINTAPNSQHSSINKYILAINNLASDSIIPVNRILVDINPTKRVKSHQAKLKSHPIPSITSSHLTSGNPVKSL